MNITRSNIFESVCSSDIGLVFVNKLESPFLKIGITLAILNAFGYIPVCNIWFIINVKGMCSSFFKLFTLMLDKPSQPELSKK